MRHPTPHKRSKFPVVLQHAAVERNQTAESLMKLAFEKYFLWKARNGYVNLI